MIHKLIIGFFAFALYACLGKSPVTKNPCTQQAVAGLNVVVKDQQTNLFLHDSLTIIAGTGTYTENLEIFPGNPPTFSGAWERADTYTLNITRPRYRPLVSAPIVVIKDECHVIPQSFTLSLLPK